MSRAQQVWAWLVLLGFTAMLVYLNLITPLWSDDYVYRFVFDARYYYDESFTRLVSSWQDILDSQIAHYCCTNGRFVAHTLAQAFLCSGHGWLWSMANSLCFVVSLWLLWRFACQGNAGQDAGKRWVGFLLTLGLYWLLLPHPGQLFFWLTGSCNYQWTALFVLGLLNLLFLPAPRVLSWLLYPVALLAGNGNEALSLGLALALGVYAVLRFRELSFHQVVGLLCFFAGTASNVFSPGAAARLEMAGDSVGVLDLPARLAYAVEDITKVMEKEPKLLLVPLAALLLSLLPCGRTRFRAWLLLAAWLSLALAVYVRMIDPRASFGFFLYSFMAALPVVLALFMRLPRWCRHAVALVLLLVVGKGMLNAAYDIPRFETYEQSLIRAARSGCEFVIPHMDAPYSRYNHSTFLTENCSGMHNRAVAAYYGTRPFGVLSDEEWAKVQSIPQQTYECLKEGEYCRATEDLFLLRLQEVPLACHVTGYGGPEAGNSDDSALCWGGLGCAVVQRYGGCYVIVFYDGRAHEAGLRELHVRLMKGHTMRRLTFDPLLSWGVLVCGRNAACER